MDPAVTQIDDVGQDNLPPEIQDLLDDIRAAKNAKIETLGKEVARKRDDAVKFRKGSGIEDVWTEDEEYYLGIDEANRGSHQWQKSPSTSGGISHTPATPTNRCTAFFNITRQFVESASARMGDILLPAGDWNFSVKATPVQDEVPGEEALPAAAPPQPTPQAPPAAGASPVVAAVQPPPVDPKIKRQADADARAEKGEAKIQDWLIEGSYHTEVRKVIEDSAKLGSGILKGPFPEKFTVRKALEDAGRTTLEITTSINPKSKAVECWNLFPDPACGDDIHKGSFILERDFLNAKQLKDLKGLKGYLSEQIDKVLDEGPGQRHYEDGRRLIQEQTADSEEYEVWYYYGQIDVSGLSAMNTKITSKHSEKNMLPAIITLVNDTPIKAFVNPIESGEFPYDIMTWQRVPGSPWGIGVSRQGRTAQDMLNGAARSMMDNAGLSSGPMLIIRQGIIYPADGDWNLTARKVWIAKEQADIKRIEEAFHAVNIPMMQAELAAIIQLAYKMMEDSTGIFFIMQGQQGTAPDTVGGMELLHKNASAILRRLARIFDERITEPHIRRYYEWLLLHGPEDCKGDLKIQAIGSTSLVEREIQSMEAMVLLQLSANPIYELDPAKAMVEVLKSKRFIPDKWTLDETKKAEMAKRQPSIPAIEVAKIRAAQDDKKLAQEKWKVQVETTADMKSAHDDMDRDLLYADTMARRDQTTQQVRMEELKIKRELAILDYSTKRNISLDQIKSELAREGMRLKTQKELAGVAAVAKQVAPTTMEPAGRAEPGRAFQE